MTDARVLLERHKPRLVYDSLEAYFADSAATWTDAPWNVLRRADGTVLAKPPVLSLQFLGPHAYGDGRPTLASDVIGETTRDYRAHAAALHKQPKYANRAYGHARKDRNGRLWLQYWLFYYYNDFQVLGPIGGGKHEGDWELVQIRLGPSEQPEQAVFTQHKTAESRPWADVRKPANAPNTPLVYVARGSHANYFRTGSHWTGVWWDQADGRGPQVSPTLEILGDTQPAWTQWPGSWGDTKPSSSPLDSASPRSPGRRPHWTDPAALTAQPKRLAAAPPRHAPPPPTVETRDGRLAYDVKGPPGTLLVGRAGDVRSFRIDSERGIVDYRPDGDAWASFNGSASVKV